MVQRPTLTPALGMNALHNHDAVAVGALDSVEVAVVYHHVGERLVLGAGIGVVAQGARPSKAISVADDVLQHLATFRLRTVKRTCNRTERRAQLII